MKKGVDRPGNRPHTLLRGRRGRARPDIRWITRNLMELWLHHIGFHSLCLEHREWLLEEMERDLCLLADIPIASIAFANGPTSALEKQPLATEPLVEPENVRFEKRRAGAVASTTALSAELGTNVETDCTVSLDTEDDPC